MPTFGGIVVATGGQADGRRTFSDVISELARPINAADETVRAIAADAFRAAVRTFNIKGNWPWELQDQEVIMTVNEKFSSVTGAVKKPLAMHYLTASGGVMQQPVSYQPYDRFLEKYNLDITSEPHTYTLPNLFETGQIRWYPTPSSTRTMMFSYYRKTPAPRNEQEALEIPDYVTEVYMKEARMEFLQNLPSAQRPADIGFAVLAADKSFKSISAHVNEPGDRSRYLDAIGGRG